MWAILPQFRNFRRLAVMKFQKDLYLDKYGFFSVKIKLSRVVQRQKEFFPFEASDR